MRLAGLFLVTAVITAIVMPPRPHSTPATADKPSELEPADAKPASFDHASVGNGFAQVSIPRSPDGHFYLDAQVNGTTIHFLVDTGASTIALSRQDAQSAGVQFASGDFTGTAETAGGKVLLKPVTLDRVAAGPLEARDVTAVVVETPMGVSLLGQTWLERVAKVTIENDRLTLG